MNWKPVRRGPYYCSPACGGKCLWSDYLSAVRRGKALAKKLGPGWEPVIHENLGWHYRAVSGTAAVYERDAASHKYWPRYSACLDNLYWCDGPTPKQAIRATVNAVRAAAEKLLSSVEGL